MQSELRANWFLHRSRWVIAQLPEGLLKESVSLEDDGWEMKEMQVQVKQVQMKEMHRDDGGMPAQPLVELPAMEGLEDCSHHQTKRSKLYGIMMAEFKDHLLTGKGLSWMMQPGGWGSFTMYRDSKLWEQKCKEYERHARTPDDFKQALCLVTIDVKTDAARKWLQEEDVLVPHSNQHLNKKWYWRGPISPVEKWEPYPGAVMETCYEATVSDIIEDVK